MSEHEPEETPESTDSVESPEREDGKGTISDEQLPEDLQPTEDNPLARHPGQTGDDDDKIGADTEGGDAQNPSTSTTYGENGDSSSEAPGESENAEVKAEEDDGSATLDNGGGGAG